MKRCITTVFTLIAFLLAPLVHAEMKIFPMWERKKCPTEEFACYTFEQSQAIVTIDLDLQLKLDKWEKCKIKLLNYENALDKYKRSVELDKENIQRLEVRIGEKQDVLDKTTANYISAYKRDVFGGALPWVLGVTLVLLAGSFVAGWYVGSR